MTGLWNRYIRCFLTCKFLTVIWEAPKIVGSKYFPAAFVWVFSNATSYHPVFPPSPALGAHRRCNLCFHRDWQQHWCCESPDSLLVLCHGPVFTAKQKFLKRPFRITEEPRKDFAGKNVLEPFRKEITQPRSKLLYMTACQVSKMVQKILI